MILTTFYVWQRTYVVCIRVTRSKKKNMLCNMFRNKSMFCNVFRNKIYVCKMHLLCPSYFVCNCWCRICNFDWWCPNLYISSTRITSANCVLQLIVIYIALIEVFMLLQVLKHIHLSHYTTTLYIVGIFLKYMMHHKNDTH